MLPLTSVFICASVLAPDRVILGHGHLLGRLKDAPKHARQWALWVGNRVLELIQQPTLAAVQACIVISSYWASQGDTHRYALFSGNSPPLENRLPHLLPVHR